MKTIAGMTDTELGAIVRQEATRFERDQQAGIAYAHAAALALIQTAHAVGSTKTHLFVERVTCYSFPIGDWEVNVRRVDIPSETHAMGEIEHLAKSLHETWRSTLTPEQQIDNHDWFFAGDMQRQAYMYLAWLIVKYRRYHPEHGASQWRLTLDGNQWCALLGDDLQTGVAGFGDVQADAIRDFQSKITALLPVHEI